MLHAQAFLLFSAGCVELGRLRATRAMAMLLLAAAILVASIGLLWFAAAALPHPDPTADLLAKQIADMRKARWLLAGGIVVAAVDAIWLWKTSRNSQ